MQANRPTVEAPGSGLVRYLTTAVFIRAVNDGASVGLALLAVESGATSVAGLLTAALVAPHLLGPWLGQWYARSADGRRVLAVSFAGYGVALATAASLFGQVPVPVVVLAVAVAGCSGPMLSGGLTSRLPRSDSDPARALDSATWAVATMVGPAATSVLAFTVGSRNALLLLAVGACCAAAMMFTLAPDGRHDSAIPAARLGEVFRLVLRTGSLRRTIVAGGLAGLALGTFPVATPLLSMRLGEPAGGGGLLVAAFGLGTLVGCVTVAVRPLPTAPERILSRCLAVMAVAMCGAAAAPSYPLAMAALGLLGLANGPFLAALLACCQRQAPDGTYPQVLVITSSTKITAASVAGLCAGLAGSASGGAGARNILFAASAVLLTAALATVRRVDA